MLELNLVSRAQASWGEGVEFFGELSNEQFASYAEVSSLAGVTNGTLHNEGSGWLKFEMDGKELIVSKRPMRNSISWDHLNSVGCVFGSKVITILGNRYRVRLLKGADTDPTPVNSGYFQEGSHNSEWSRLFYPLITDDSYLNNQYTGPKDPRYTNNDLGMTWVDEATTPGAYSWCQETHQDNASYRVYRGPLGVSYLSRTASARTFANYGWRPVLEALPPVLPPEPKVFYYYHPDVTFFGPTNARGNYVSDLSELGIS